MKTPLLCLLVALLISVCSGMNAKQEQQPSASGAAFMGFYTMYNASDLHGWGNAWWSPSPEELVAAHNEFGYTHQLLALEWHFVGRTPQGNRLITNWEESWANIWAPIGRELLNNGTIVGFFLGDELMWGGLPYEQLVAWSNLIRATFPSAFLWENEALPVYDCDAKKNPQHCRNARREVVNITDGIPPALNATSIDWYDWSNSSAAMLHVQHVEAYYIANLYARAHSGQKFFVIPGSAGSTHNPHCDLQCYMDVVTTRADQYLSWMQRDKNIVGMMPWTWLSCGTPCIHIGDELGTAHMPPVADHWRSKIGPAVMQLSRP